MKIQVDTTHGKDPSDATPSEDPSDATPSANTKADFYPARRCPPNDRSSNDAGRVSNSRSPDRSQKQAETEMDIDTLDIDTLYGSTNDSESVSPTQLVHGASPQLVQGKWKLMVRAETCTKRGRLCRDVL